jgi:hypothetical protein
MSKGKKFFPLLQPQRLANSAIGDAAEQAAEGNNLWRIVVRLQYQEYQRDRCRRGRGRVHDKNNNNSYISGRIVQLK